MPRLDCPSVSAEKVLVVLPSVSVKKMITYTILGIPYHNYIAYYTPKPYSIIKAHTCSC